MHVLGVDRVMLATWNLEETRAQFDDLLGIGFSDLLEPTTSTDHGEQPVTNVISPTGVELVAPRSEENEVARFLDANGPGLYALSLRVADLDAAKAELESKEVHSVGEFAHDEFREAFFHPRNFGGAMLILAEYDAPHPAVTAADSDAGGSTAE